jgi:hypothetical protein
METQMNLSYTHCMRACVLEMRHNSSSGIFDSVYWTNSVYLVKNLGEKTAQIKMRPLWENLDERKIEHGPDNVEHSLRAAD